MTRIRQFSCASTAFGESAPAIRIFINSRFWRSLIRSGLSDCSLAVTPIFGTCCRLRQLAGARRSVQNRSPQSNLASPPQVVSQTACIPLAVKYCKTTAKVATSDCVSTEHHETGRAFLIFLIALPASKSYESAGCWQAAAAASTQSCVPRGYIILYFISFWCSPREALGVAF